MFGCFVFFFVCFFHVMYRQCCQLCGNFSRSGDFKPGICSVAGSQTCTDHGRELPMGRATLDRVPLVQCTAHAQTVEDLPLQGLTDSQNPGPGFVSKPSQVKAAVHWFHIKCAHKRVLATVVALSQLYDKEWYLVVAIVLHQTMSSFFFFLSLITDHLCCALCDQYYYTHFSYNLIQKGSLHYTAFSVTCLMA